jgi:hypothetical protein
MVISDGIDGSPTSYNITYSDFNSGRICGTFSIPAATCVDGVCRHTSRIASPCLPSDDISLSVLSTNILGSGPPSRPVVFSLIANNDQSEYLYDIVYHNLSMKYGRTQLANITNYIIPCPILGMSIYHIILIVQECPKNLRSSRLPLYVVLWDVYFF